MTELRVHNFSVSLDGYAAGPGQSVENPLGVGGEQLHEWIFSPDATDVDRRFRVFGDEDIGATLMGRNMSGPVRDDWGASDWAGRWGEDPPFHHDVIVLTQHARDPVPMAGGTTFHFVTDGIEAVLDRARAAAGGSSRAWTT
jgi:dihydrofolate reductase